jgi:hypothetical protein
MTLWTERHGIKTSISIFMQNSSGGNMSRPISLDEFQVDWSCRVA